MKNIIKFISFIALFAMFSCDQGGERFNDQDSDSGWVEFQGSNTGQTISIITEQLNLPLSINVPTYREGLTVSYRLEAVEGDFTSIVTTGSSIFVDPTDVTRSASIPLFFSGVSDLTEIVIFDVVLTSVDNNLVSIGVDNESVTRYRISTPCPIDINSFAGTYSVEEMFTGPPNAPFGLSFFFGQSYQVDITVDATDVTETTVIINNSPGFDTYFTDGIKMNFDTCNFTFTMSEDTPELALFNNMSIITTEYDDVLNRMQADGTFGNFGDYQFVLTKL